MRRTLSYLVTELKSCLPLLSYERIRPKDKINLLTLLYFHNRIFFRCHIKNVSYQEGENSSYKLIPVKQDNEKCVFRHPDKKFRERCQKILIEDVRERIRTLNQIKSMNIPAEIKEIMINPVIIDFYELKDAYEDFMKLE